MLKVALTGNIAAGKSTVVGEWKRHGAVVVDADQLAREAVEPGTQGLARVVERWGPGVLLASGELDRAALRDVVFRDAAARRELEAIVHPEVQRLRSQAFSRAERKGATIVVADIPLLFEVGMEGEFDVVVLVDAPDDVRLDRLVRERGLNPAEARRMIDAQWTSEHKRPRSDIVIENVASVARLRARAREVWESLLTRAAAEGTGP